MRLARDDELHASDMRSFWLYAGTWMLRVSALVSIYKLGGTLFWARSQGYDVQLGFWFRVLPHFDIQVSPDRFVRLVTLSTWLGILGGFTGLVWAFASASRVKRAHRKYRNWLGEYWEAYVAAHLDEDAHAAGNGADASLLAFGDLCPSTDEMLDFDNFSDRSARGGLWLGAWIGSLTLLVTTILELARHYYSGEYVWGAQHVVAAGVTTIPLIALVTMWRLGRFGGTLAVDQVADLLSASGVGIDDRDAPDDQQPSDGIGTHPIPTTFAATLGS